MPNTILFKAHKLNSINEESSLDNNRDLIIYSNLLQKDKSLQYVSFTQVFLTMSKGGPHFLHFPVSPAGILPVYMVFIQNLALPALPNIQFLPWL